jgi:hypothetical protein
VLGGRSSGGAGFGLWASLVTSLAEGGTMCWSSSAAHGATGSSRVGGSSMNGADGKGEEAMSERGRAVQARR